MPAAFIVGVLRCDLDFAAAASDEGENTLSFQIFKAGTFDEFLAFSA